MRSLILALPLLLSACEVKVEPAKPPAPPPTMPAPAASGDRAKDVICGMPVDKATAPKVTHEGTNYYFCAEECVKKFKADPKKHATPCSCGKTSSKCPCEHCGHHLGKCDCGK